jgi:ABC-type transport system substrate-binding protein
VRGEYAEGRITHTSTYALMEPVSEVPTTITPALITVASSSDWAYLTFPQYLQVAWYEVTDERGDPIEATFSDNVVALTQPLDQAEAGNWVWMKLELALADLEPGQTLEFVLERGGLGTAAADVYGLVDGEPRLVKRVLWEGDSVSFSVPTDDLLSPPEPLGFPGGPVPLGSPEPVVEVVDDYTVVVIFSEAPNSAVWPFRDLSNYRFYPPASRVARQAAAGDLRRGPVGTGPYLFSMWEPGEYIRLVRNPDYWAGSPSDWIPFLVDETLEVPPEVVIFNLYSDEDALVSALLNGNVDWALLYDTDRQAELQERGFIVLTPTSLSLMGADRYIAYSPGAHDPLICGLFREPYGLDPWGGFKAEEWVIASAIYEGLTGYTYSFETPGYQGIPVLAQAWDVSEDGLTWTFRLKEGIRFHDGRELTAYDVMTALTGQ